MTDQPSSLVEQIRACRICADRFLATQTAHTPRPVAWFSPNARLLIAGQAPGARVHSSGIPFDDPSGDRLRAWLGVGRDCFYDKDQIAIIPMAFCFPGYNERGADLPPPVCAKTWHERVMSHMQDVRLTILVGGYAQKWHLGPMARGGVTKTVQNWRDHLPRIIPLPHPSWRNTAWLGKNPWFTAELLPVLRSRVAEVLQDDEPDSA